MSKIFNYGKQHITKDDITSVIKSLKSETLTKGPYVDKFESNFSKYTGAKYSVSCSSGTAALHLVYKALNIRKNDIVIAPTITFAASVNPASLMGAKILFADCDSSNGLILYESVNQIINKLIKKKKIQLLKAIVLVNLNGQSVNIKLFKSLSKQYGFAIIEDSCHSLGSKYKKPNNGRVGSCKFSDFSTFSFHPVKNITTGEGGMVTLNNKKLYNKIKLLRNHSIEINYKKKIIEPWHYEFNDIFLNYRMSDINASLGISQLKQINKIIAKKILLANFYRKNIIKFNLPVSIISDNNFSNHSYHLFVILIDFKKLKISKKILINNLKKHKIFTQVHYIPLHTHPYYKKLYNQISNFKNAKKYYDSALSLPLYYSLTFQDILFILKILRINLIKN